MPTAYTAILTRRDDVSLEEFAMRCARAFGAAIMLRDDPLETPIPEFTVGDYYKQAVSARTAELQAFMALDLTGRVEFAKEQIQRQLQEIEDSKKGTLEENARYDSMAGKVMRWTPPTPGHDELKAFMLEQLEMSKESTNWTDQAITVLREADPEDWARGYQVNLNRQLAEAIRTLQKQQRRTDEGNEWVRKLRLSLSENRERVSQCQQQQKRNE